MPVSDTVFRNYNDNEINDGAAETGVANLPVTAAFNRWYGYGYQYNGNVHEYPTTSHLT